MSTSGRLEGGYLQRPEVQLRGALERLTRCYDPCISCPVHLFEL